MPDKPSRPAWDARLLALLGKAVEEADPIAWEATELDRDLAYDIMASQIAEMFQRYDEEGTPRERQMLIALGTVVKLTVENFVLHQRMLRDGLDARRTDQRGPSQQR